jgi:UDP-N-acetylmuramoyl-tripeptide--D-alanyl-D-alanine ligase
MAEKQEKFCTRKIYRMKIDSNFMKDHIPHMRLTGASFSHIEGSWRVDSRCVMPGDVFIALSGEQHNGHSFVEDAFARGARWCIVKEECWPELEDVIKRFLVERTCIIVADPFEALTQWASAWRKQFKYPVIGITGSLGKTSTKEYIAHVFRLCGKSYVASEGNQNTLLGSALNILRMRSHHEYAIFEMGIDSRGEMQKLVNLVAPTTAVITSIGHQHMAGLGALPDIAAEKRLIFSALQQDGIGFINGDQPLLSHVAYRHPVIKFGLKMVNQIRAGQVSYHDQKTSCVIKLYRDRFPLTLATEHSASVYHALAAAAVAHYFDIPSSSIVQALQEPLEVPRRFQKRIFGAVGQHMIIDDTYNANPESMKAALLAFERCEVGGKKIAILGDMLGLGINAPFWHRQIGRFLRKTSSFQHVILVGEHMKWACKMLMHGTSFELQPTWQEAVTSAQRYINQAPSCILVKGSSGVGLSHAVTVLMEQA